MIIQIQSKISKQKLSFRYRAKYQNRNCHLDIEQNKKQKLSFRYKAKISKQKLAFRYRAKI